jgi:hypothetical protein
LVVISATNGKSQASILEITLFIVLDIEPT